MSVDRPQGDTGGRVFYERVVCICCHGWTRHNPNGCREKGCPCQLHGMLILEASHDALVEQLRQARGALEKLETIESEGSHGCPACGVVHHWQDGAFNKVHDDDCWLRPLLAVSNPVAAEEETE